MTPAQKTALEGLILGRSLTDDEVSAIDPLLPGRQDGQIAEVLNAGRGTALVSLLVEDVFDTLYFSGDYLTLKSAQLAGNPLAALAFSVLDDAKRLGVGKVKLDAAPTVVLLSQLRDSGLLTQAGIDALHARATVKVPDTITPIAVSRALNGV